MRNETVNCRLKVHKSVWVLSGGSESLHTGSIRLAPPPLGDDGKGSAEGNRTADHYPQQLCCGL